MLTKVLLRPILHDEAVTRGLGDPEARLLVEWLVEQAERLGAEPGDVARGVDALCRRARSISRFVRLWCHDGLHGAACQLAATERFHWPLPSTPLDPCELMQHILDCEADAAA